MQFCAVNYWLLGVLKEPINIYIYIFKCIYAYFLNNFSIAMDHHLMCNLGFEAKQD